MNKKFAFVFSLLIGSAMLTGCGSGQENSSNQRNPNVTVNWDSVISNLENSDISTHGLYFNTDEAKETIDDFGYISFTNYEEDFQSVDYQLCISYGDIDCDEVDSITEAVYEINILDNSGYNTYYYTVRSMDNEILYEEGNWFIQDEQDSTITEWLVLCNNAMGLN